MIDDLFGMAEAAFTLLAQLAPYLLLGVVAAGLLHVLLPAGGVSRHLGRGKAASVLKAALLGIPLPICSCGVLPLAATLKKEGASDGATVSFLVTTPTTGIDSILATYSLLGLPIAAARVVVAFVLGTVAGLFAQLVTKRDGAPMRAFAMGCATGSTRGLKGRLVESLRYGFDELFGGIARPLAIGTALGALVVWFVPDGSLLEQIGGGPAGYFVMAVIGVPLYVCASGSIPLAAALLAKGLSPGAVLVFLIAGPATSMAAIAVVGKVLGKRVLAVYLAVLVLGSIAAGAVTDALFGWVGFSFAGLATSHAHAQEPLAIHEIAAAVLLLALMAFHAGRKAVAVARAGSRAPFAKAVVFAVPDMSCASCARSIERAVSPIAGVRAVRVDVPRGEVSVEIDARADAGRIEAAIAATGFSPKRREAR